MTNDTRLWCLHHIGADEVHPAPDFETAWKWATWANERFADDADICRFTVAVWPWSPEGHADGLAASIADWTLPTPAQPVDETERLRDKQGKCSCAEVHGENPACPKHGLGTKWALENPEPGSEGLPDRLIAYADNMIANRAMGMAAMADDLRQAANEIECIRAALQHKGEVSRG